MAHSSHGVFRTDAGMLALWSPAEFPHITDYETWESQLIEDQDIERHIRAGALVPLYIHSDGAFGYGVHVGDSDAPAVLMAREQLYLITTSAPYFLVATATRA